MRLWQDLNFKPFSKNSQRGNLTLLPVCHESSIMWINPMTLREILYKYGIVHGKRRYFSE